MRYLTLVVPEKLSVENTSTGNSPENVKLTSHSEGPEVSFIRKGEDASTGAPLSIYPTSGVPGGIFNRSRQGGLTTRKAFSPYKFAHSFESTPTNDDFYGVTELGVRKFLRSNFDDPTTTNTRGQGYQSGRVFSFEGDMFYLCEARISLGTNYATVPKLFKYNQASDLFEFSHLFEDPVSIYRQISGANNQKGSPDYFIFKGLLHIGYRVINKDSRRNEVVIWQRSDEGRWRRIASVPISNSFDNLEVTSLRVRFATSPDAIMLVYYSLDRFLRTGSIPRERHDMRSYVSYDGVNFASKSKAFETVTIDENNNFLSGTNITNMAYHFIPRQEYNGDYSYLVGFNVNFALYYDRTLASFVILKSGDPAGKPNIITGITTPNGNDSWLMGIKTLEGDYLTWENCVNFEIKPSNTGVLPDEDGIEYGQPETNSELDPWTYRMRIIDIDVVEGPSTNVMAVTWREFNGNDKRSGVCLNEFEFISVEQIESGSEDYHYNVGSKAHPEWSFLTRRFDPDACGLSCGGTYSVNPVNGPANVSIGKWRGQVVVTAILNFNVTFTLFSQWQNVSESSGYQFSYSAAHGPVGRFSHVDEIGGTYSTPNRYYTFPAASGGLFMANSGDVVTPDLLNLNTPSQMSRLEMKSRFSLSVVSGSNAEVFRVLLKSQLENVIVKLSLEIGQIFVFHNIGAGDVFNVAWNVPVTDWSSPHEFIFGAFGSTVWLYYRQVGTDKFFLAGEVTLPTTGISLGASSFFIGALGGTSNVVVYDVQVGTYNRAHRATFSQSTRFSSAELSNRNPSGPNSPTIEADDLPVELMDGSLVSLRGVPHQANQVFKYEFVSSVTSNTPISLVDGISDRLFDFTSGHSSSDHCHCYVSSDVEPNDQTYGYQLLFSKDPRQFDAFSLINAFGFHCFDLVIGEHDGTEWSSVLGQARYKLTRKELSVVSFTGSAFVTEDIFDQGQIVGYCVMKYSTISKSYEDTYQVRRNFQKLVVLDRDIVALESHHELHLFFTSATYQLPEDLIAVSHLAKNVGVKIYGVPSAELIGLGEFILGQSFDLSEFAHALSASMEGDVTITTGEYGLSFNKGQTYRPAIETFALATSVKRGGMELVNMLRQVQRDELLMALVEQRSNGSNWTWPVVKGNVSYGSMDYLQEIQVNFTAQNYFAKKILKETYEPPTLVLSHAEKFVIGIPVAITATATDPAGGTLSYEWFVSGVKVAETGSVLNLTVTDYKTVETVRCFVRSSVSNLGVARFGYLFRSELPNVTGVSFSGPAGDALTINVPDGITVSLDTSGGSFGSNYISSKLGFYEDTGQIDPATGEPVYVKSFAIDFALDITFTSSVIGSPLDSEVELRFYSSDVDVDIELTSDPGLTHIIMVYEDDFGQRLVKRIDLVVV